MLGLFAAGVPENFYWTHPALQSAESAVAFYGSDVWHNSGGDRTWLAPEVDIFFPKFPDLDMSTYWQPRELDPGQYEVVSENGTLRLSKPADTDAFAIERTGCPGDGKVGWTRAQSAAVREG